MKKHVVVIGGGIAGLSAAWEMQKHANGRMNITLLERESQWGGKISTKRVSTPQGDPIIQDEHVAGFTSRISQFILNAQIMS